MRDFRGVKNGMTDRGPSGTEPPQKAPKRRGDMKRTKKAKVAAKVKRSLIRQAMTTKGSGDGY